MKLENRYLFLHDAREDPLTCFCVTHITCSRTSYEPFTGWWWWWL